MKTKIEIKSFLLGALLGGVLAVSVAAGIAKSQRGAVEYKLVSANAMNGDLQDAINRAGQDGYEFQSASQCADHWVCAVTKREKVE